MDYQLTGQTIFSTEQLAEQVADLGARISSDFQGRDLVVVGVLKGSFVFLADLIRAIEVPLCVEFIGVSSYKGTQSTGQVRITHDLSIDLEGKNVLLVEDIVDSGVTIDYLLDLLKVRNPAALKVCTLLSKPHAHKMKHDLDYVGFTVGDEFVVGYGLDVDGRFRELPYIGTVEQKSP